MQNGFQTLKSQVYQTLRQEILTGITPPGTRLVRRVLSKRLGVSPIPVIEALHQLEQDGLVESEPMFGHRVRLLNLEAVRNDHIMREAIECQCARLCAQNCSDEQLTLLAKQADELDQLPVSEHDGSFHADVHLEFHLGIARMTGYAALVKALENLWFRRLMVINTVNAALMGVPPAWHAQLVKALASRDPEIAEKAMRKHVQFNVAAQLKNLEETLLKAIPSRANGAAAETASPKKPAVRGKRGRPPAK